MMKSPSAAAMIAALFLFVTLARASNDNSVLYSAFTLINQGASSPAIPVPTFKWSDWEERTPFELTAAGMREQYLLGWELRRRYDLEGLLIPEKLIDEVMVRAIDHNGTVTSALAFMRGFLGDNVEQLTPEQLQKALPPLTPNEYFVNNIKSNVLPYKLGTLPYHTHYPHERDIFAHCSCQKANEYAYANFTNSSEVQNILAKYDAAFVELVKQRYQRTVKFPDYVPLLESIHGAMRQYRDVWLNAEQKSLVSNFMNGLYPYMKVNSSAANKYRAIPMMKYIRMILDKTVEKPTNPAALRLGLVFTEDTMMSSLLAQLGYKVAGPMPTSSIVTFEIRGEKKAAAAQELTISLLYNDMPVRIADCDFPACSYGNFTKLVDKMLEDEGKVNEACAAEQS